ncbi:MAG: hypothetical protein HYT09_01910 [Candidatus Levybacteria bacterium]|nr:hypothetical protein [Candidatus Levybacteria bacterium]
MAGERQGGPKRQETTGVPRTPDIRPTRRGSNLANQARSARTPRAGIQTVASAAPDVRPVAPAPRPGIEGLRDIDDVGNLRPQVAPVPNGIDDLRGQAPDMDRGAPGATVGRPTSPDSGRSFVGVRKERAN